MDETLHIVPHTHVVDRQTRHAQKNHRSLVVWLTGLSGSGKSTIANLLEQQLIAQQAHTYILDGDNIRTGLNKDLDFSEEGRVENIRRIAEVARLFVDAGIVVITAFISPYRADRELARALIGPACFVEVFVDCPLEICEQRDVKGLYKKARAGVISHFTGISAPFETPDNPQVIVHTDQESLTASVDKIHTYIQPLLLL